MSSTRLSYQRLPNKQAKIAAAKYCSYCQISKSACKLGNNLLKARLKSTISLFCILTMSAFTESMHRCSLKHQQCLSCQPSIGVKPRNAWFILLIRRQKNLVNFTCIPVFTPHLKIKALVQQTNKCTLSFKQTLLCSFTDFKSTGRDTC